jgi:hypothetical protein
MNVCGYKYFNEYRKKLNIGFSQLSVDKIKICKEHDLHLIDNSLCACELCKKYEEHKIKYKLAEKQSMKIHKNYWIQLLSHVMHKRFSRFQDFKSGIVILRQELMH